MQNRCVFCNSLINSGVEDENKYKFCDSTCLYNYKVISTSNLISDDIVEENTKQIHQGHCPICKKQRGSIDVHYSHSIYSLLLYSSWNSKTQISCRFCGLKSQIISSITSFLFGWWGFPWGMIYTPIQLIKNLDGIFLPSESTKPSIQLRNQIKLRLIKASKDFDGTQI